MEEKATHAHFFLTELSFSGLGVVTASGSDVIETAKKVVLHCKNFYEV